jgi:hypothetical protein
MRSLGGRVRQDISEASGVFRRFALLLLVGFSRFLETLFHGFHVKSREESAPLFQQADSGPERSLRRLLLALYER